jgi:hypothetical protein
MVAKISTKIFISLWYNKRVLIWHFTLVFMKSYAGNWQINCNSRNWRNQMTEQYRTIGPEIQGFLSDRQSFYRTCPSVRRYFIFHMWVDYDVPKWFLTSKYSTGRHFQNGQHNTAQIQHCSISMSWIDSRHWKISTGLHFIYQILISDNVEYLRYCGGHFENGDR